MVIFGKEPMQALRRDVGRDGGHIEALAGTVHRFFVDIGREDLHFHGAEQFEIQTFHDDDGDGIGFFAGGAAGDPNPHTAVCGLVFQHRRQHVFFPRLEGFRIAKKVRDSDQDLPEQEVEFVGVLLQKPDVPSDVSDLMDIHPAFDTPIQGVFL
jgi:hypothetical protein